MEHIGQKIKDLRKKADLTQDRLADYLGVTAQAVSKWEVGQTAPDLSLIAPLCRVLGCSADELLGIAEENGEEIQAMIDELQLTPHRSETIRRIAKTAAEKYPRNERLSLAIAIAERSADTNDRNEGRALRADAEKRFVTILSETADPEFRSSAATSYALFLIEEERRDEAAKIAEQITGGLKDEILLKCLDGDEWLDRQQFLVYRSLNKLCGFLEHRGFERKHLPSLEAAEAAIRAVLCDGNYIGYSNRLYVNACEQIKHLMEAGEYARTVEKLRDRMEYAAQYGKLLAEAKGPDTYLPYTAPALDGFGEDSAVWGHIDPRSADEFSTLNLLNVLKSDFYAPLRSRDDFKALLAELESPGENA